MFRRTRVCYSDSLFWIYFYGLNNILIMSHNLFLTYNMFNFIFLKSSVVFYLGLSHPK